MDRGNEYIRFDWAMKHMLRDKANFDILEGLISVLLGQDVKIIELLESESNQDGSTDKFNRVDIKAKNSQGENILLHIELLSKFFYYFRLSKRRCLVISKPKKIGDKYDQVKKVYSISILYCDFGRGDDYIYHGETNFKGLHTGEDLVVNLKEEGVIVPHLPKEVFPEYYLVRVNAYDKVPETPLDEWIDYLKTGKIKEDTRTPGLQQVREKLRVLAMLPKEKRAYEAHIDNIMVQNDVLDTAREEGYSEGRTEGRAEGRVEGRAEGKKEVAIAMISNGLTDDLIRQLTGLSPAKIATLRQASKS